MKAEQRKKVGFFEDLHDPSGGRGRVAKSIIERNESGTVTRVIVRNDRWPYYDGSLPGEEWIISENTVQITTVRKKHGIITKSFNISDISLFEVKKPSSLGYTGSLAIVTKKPYRKRTSILQSKYDRSYAGMLYNQFDFLAAVAAGELVREQCIDAVNNGTLEVKIDQTLIDFRTLLDAGDPETLKMVEYRNIPY